MRLLIALVGALLLACEGRSPIESVVVPPSTHRVWISVGGSVADVATGAYVVRPTTTLTAPDFISSISNGPATIAIEPATGAPWVTEIPSGSWHVVTTAEGYWPDVRDIILSTKANRIDVLLVRAP
jgi:hypothetical protein